MIDPDQTMAAQGLVSGNPAYNILNGLPPFMPADAYGRPDWTALKVMQARRLDPYFQTLQYGTDRVRAMLTPGEAVLNRNAAEILGRDKIRSLNAKGNQVQSYQGGTDYVNDNSSSAGKKHPAGQRSRSFFPSVDSRFMGALEPSPRRGSYYNPARYAGEGFSRRELNRIQRNLANAYQRDVEYNRVANPQYQTVQDTGYGSFDQFGSGRASPATTQAYAMKYGRPTGNGLSTFQTPSGGSITYRPSGRNLPGGAQPLVSPFSAVSAPINYGAEYAKGYGAPTPTVQGGYLTQGGVANPVENLTPQQRIQYGAGSGLDYLRSNPALGALGSFAYNTLNSIFGRPKQSQVASNVPWSMGGGGVGYSQSGPRRYFDE